uniref:Amanexitide proprotein 1 n=1 Tax=Amanita exitialis TaxID=262245 RepID=AMAN1_AMAEX|nr:RecName: Full=Amanexitide proprotein 1; Contains: RecName: Full=Amanexitide 1; Flags: Precursor [Amanita exitialis]AGW83703.1 amanexitide 1 [Amanita exitialis]
MSDINTARLPVFSLPVFFPFVSDDIQAVLTRGESLC